MPQLVAFNRNWSIGSDDFVFSSSLDFLIRTIWMVVVVIIYAVNRDNLDKNCTHGDLLHAYIIGLICILAITAVLAVVMTYVSMQGTIADSSPRRRMPLLLYIRLAVAVPEVSWNAVGTYWAFSLCKDCHRNIVNIAKGTVVAGWVLVLIAIVGVVVVFNVYGPKRKVQTPTRVRSFKRGSRRPFQQTKHWEKRCKCLFCCASGDDRSVGVFSTLAQLSADYFKGVDLVPTDVLAGLVLLSWKQERKRQQLTLVVSDGNVGKRPLEDIPDGVELRVPDDIVPDDWMTLDLMSHYLKFALGSYGWPFYVTLTNPVFGMCALCSECRCCSCRDDQGNIFMDNCCMCNSAAFKKTTGVTHEDIVYANFKNDIYEIPFYVVIDSKYNAVVIAVRGTLSLQDVITDLVIERGDMQIDGVPCACAHNGILQSAKYIKEILDEKHILEEAFSRIEGKQLIVTGHSLGAGTAALLAILLKPSYPTLRCYAFSPPGELVSPDVCDYAKDVVCSVVLGDDIITRQGMLMMDDLKIQIIKAIHETKLPKYKILASGCWRMCCGRSGNLDEDIKSAYMENGSTHSEDDTKKYTINRSSLEVSMGECLKHSETIKNSYQPLHLPGKILHIEESNFSGDEQLCANFKKKEQFTEIIVSPNMVSHHFPDAMLDAIDGLIERSYDITSAIVRHRKDDIVT